MRPARVVLIVLDSVGIGALPDAAAYGDEDSDTVGHLAATIGLDVPVLRRLGLARVAGLPGDAPPPIGAAGRMAQASAGKDSITGHWELMGVVLERPFPVFPQGFPADLMRDFAGRIGRSTLGNYPASGTAIIEELGPEHLRTGAPIVYTSADSVFQIAAHEAVIPLDELYAMCAAAFDLAARGRGVARIIARPFVGTPGSFARTANRRDFALEPTGATVLDRLVAAGHETVCIGKVDDLFAGRGVTRAIHTSSDAHGLDVIEAELERGGRGLVFANLVDADTRFGHRNDPEGYAANLEQVDARIGDLLARLAPTDLLIVTADHGNDPTTRSSDHSREYVPVMLAGSTVRPAVDLGTRPTLADLGQTLAELFDVPAVAHGTSFLADVLR